MIKCAQSHWRLTWIWLVLRFKRFIENEQVAVFCFVFCKVAIQFHCNCYEMEKKTSNFCVVELVRILVSRCGSSEIISIKRIESSFSASETKHQPKNGLNMFIWIDESSILFNGFGRVLRLISELLVTFSCKRQHLNELEKVTRGRNLRMF